MGEGEHRRREAAAHVFVDDLETLELAGEDRAHLGRVLRLRPGETVSASDGRGGWRLARWRGAGGSGPGLASGGGGLASGGGGLVEAAGPVEWSAPPEPPITVALAVLKGDRMDWAVQKLTEVGVDRVVPMVTDRAVVRWDGERRRLGAARLRAVARAAAMQSRRLWLPEVDEVKTFAEVVAGGEGRAALADPGGGPPALSRPVVLIGPEGGWSEAERWCGLPATGLGPTVLRAETAAVAAGYLLAALRCHLVSAAQPF